MLWKLQVHQYLVPKIVQSQLLTLSWDAHPSIVIGLVYVHQREQLFAELSTSGHRHGHRCWSNILIKCFDVSMFKFCCCTEHSFTVTQLVPFDTFVAPLQQWQKMELLKIAKSVPDILNQKIFLWNSSNRHGIYINACFLNLWRCCCWFTFIKW